METALAELMEWTRANPNWAGLVVMAVSALESFLVVGLFVPGSVVMFGIGAMVAAGHMELWPTLAWATFGAVLGDNRRSPRRTALKRIARGVARRARQQVRMGVIEVEDGQVL